MVLEGPLAPDVQYRLVLPQTNTQLKYADGEATGPKKVRPIVSAGGNKLQFMFDAGRIGWDGRSLFQFVLETQDGVAGGQGQGFVDETEVKEYVP